MHARRYELTDFEWSIISPLLPNKPRGVARADDRKVLNGIYWRLRTGSGRAFLATRRQSRAAGKHRRRIFGQAVKTQRLQLNLPVKPNDPDLRKGNLRPKAHRLAAVVHAEDARALPGEEYRDLLAIAPARTRRAAAGQEHLLVR
jgi:transposase